MRKVKWRALLTDTVMVITLPLWIGPVVVIWIVVEMIDGFLDKYVE